MLEYIDFISSGSAYVPHLYMRSDCILSVSGLEPPECIHSFSEIPMVDGAVHGAARFEQRRVRVEFKIPHNYYLSNNAAATDKHATLYTNYGSLQKIDFKGISKLDIKTIDAYGDEYHYYLHNTRVEKVSYPTIGDTRNVTIDFVSDESYFCGAAETIPIWNASPDPRILSPGMVRGDGITATINLTGSTATAVKLRLWKLIAGEYEEMSINIESGAYRVLTIDTRFGQKSIELDSTNYINHLSYDSKWLKPDCERPYVYAEPEDNPYINYSTSRYSYEPAFLGVPL